MDLERNSQKIREWAGALGFERIGISRAEFLESEAGRLDQWLKKGFHGQMQYMENWYDKRLDPRKLVPGARSVISLLFNYYPSREQRPDAPKLAKYAYGEDYHFVLKRKLKTLLEKIRQEIGPVEGRAFVDSAPVMERAWAAKSGLGWIGKHSLLLNKQSGSFHFLAELIIDLPLAYDGPVTDHCGTCTKCMDACPTDAIPTPYEVDGSKCISYLTIELKDALPSSFAGKMEDWMFGCDICQDVCPWNRFSRPHSEPAFDPHPKLLEMDRSEWMELTEDLFGEIFRKSAVKRTKYSGLKRNLAFLNKGTEES